jgi:hypothetical protein
MDVFMVWHIHHFELPAGIDDREVINLDDDEDLKVIGIYSSESQAEAAIARTRLLKGFRDEPDCFVVSGYTLDVDKWTDGYVTV